MCPEIEYLIGDLFIYNSLNLELIYFFEMTKSRQFNAKSSLKDQNNCLRTSSPTLTKPVLSQTTFIPKITPPSNRLYFARVFNGS